MLRYEKIASLLERVSLWFFWTYLFLVPVTGCILLPNSSYFDVIFKPFAMKLNADSRGEIEVLSDGTNDKSASQHQLLGKLLPELNKIIHIKGQIMSNTINYNKIKLGSETEKKIEKRSGKFSMTDTSPPARPTNLGVFDDDVFAHSKSGVSLKQERVPNKGKIVK